MRILLLLLVIGFGADALLFSGQYTQAAYRGISEAVSDVGSEVQSEVDRIDEPEPADPAEEPVG